MDYKVFKGLLILFSLLANSSAIGIDGKLDFGTSHSSSASFRSNNGGTKNVFVPVKYSKPIKTVVNNDNFENIGVICISGNCNATKLSNTSDGTIQTDILVHVQTKVDLNHSKTNIVEDTPDVPVVIGRKGTKLDTTIDENSHSVFIPDLDPPSQLPLYKPAYPSTSTAFNNPPISIYSSSLTPVVSSRVNSVSTTYDNDNLSPATVDGFYITKVNPKINTNIDSSASVDFDTTAQDRTDITGVKYKANTVEINIPYFEPSYHNHYYGENPPPQLAWYPKKTNHFNPVEFKTIKSTSTPLVWNRRVSPHRHSTSAAGTGVQCTCRERQKESEVRWYPSTSKAAAFNDPGSQINDKLAPLNK